MTRSSFEDLLRHGAEPKFNYIDPPFNYNSPGVSQYPVEVSGRYLLNILCLRLGWPSLAGKRLLDFGCGVRFARTIINLGMDIGLYAGVDVNGAAIEWLQSNVADERFSFTQIAVSNQMYNPANATVADKNLLTNSWAKRVRCGLYVLRDHAPKTRRGGTDLCHSARMRRAGGSLVLYCVH